jgi:hypothetical protein
MSHERKTKGQEILCPDNFFAEEKPKGKARKNQRLHETKEDERI